MLEIQERVAKCFGKLLDGILPPPLGDFVDQEAWLENRRKGLEEFGILRKRLGELQPGEILDRLKGIHDNYGIPFIPPRQDDWSDLWFYKITEAVSNSKNLTKEDTLKMVEIVDWQEVGRGGVGGVNFNVLRAVERFPQPGVHEQMSHHLARLKKWESESRCGTHFYAALSEEIQRLEAVLPKCVDQGQVGK